MATITDFDAWLMCYVENSEEALCLKGVVESRRSSDGYDISENSGKLFVKAWGDTLMLASPRAIETFLSILESRYAHEGLSLDETCDYDRAISKND